jgi:hypothetical protein
MVHPAPHLDPYSANPAERQMRNWALESEVHERLGDYSKSAVRLPSQIRPYIAISRETGAGGGSVAQRLNQLLGWNIFGFELLGCIAQRCRAPRAMLEAIDESTPNWVAELFGRWLDRQLVTPSQYMRQLRRVMYSAARTANCIFIGRGARLILPPDRGLSVRLVAPIELRIARIMELRGHGRKEAEAFVQETDRRRRDFLAQQFGRNIDDPHLYDLVLNRASMEVDAAADLIAREACRRFALPLAP